jgi:hypothetical protein
MQYTFKTSRYNFKCTRKQSPFITQASRDGATGSKKVRILYGPSIFVKSLFMFGGYLVY